MLDLENKEKLEPVPDDRIDHMVQTIRKVIENQDQERNLLRQILMSLAFKGRTYTYDEAEVRRYDLLIAAGLKPDALSYNASRMVRQRERKQQLEKERTLRDEEKEKMK